MVIFLWGTSHYLAEGVFFSLEDAISNANMITGTNIRKEELIESTDSLPQRWIPKNTTARSLWNIRFYKREVNEK